MNFINGLFGINNALAVSQAARGLQGQDISRRGFLAGLGGLVAATVVGCGENANPAARPDGGTGGTDGGLDTGVPTDFGVESGFAALPSHYPSSLRDDAERLLGVGTAGGGMAGDRSHLFSLDPASSLRPIPSSAFLELPEEPSRFLNHLTKRPSGAKAVLTANDGFYELSVGTAPSQRFIAFPSGNNFGGGAVYAGDKLFVAAANGTVNADFTVTFGTGRILVYPLSASGVAQEGSVRTIDVTGKNPTGLALRGASTLVVLNSGPSQGGTAESSLNLIDVNSEAIVRTIPLGAFRAQLSGGLAITADGRTAVIGSSNGAGVLFVDLESGAIVSRSVAGSQFHSSVNVEDGLGLASVTDFNAGSVTFFNLATRAIIRSVMLGFGEAGPSLFLDGDLIQSGPYAAARVYPL
ncbi:MAG TPA: hypothetical protein VLJ37_11945 [bacterium]|nr:hypothetical protein [bacterium]